MDLSALLNKSDGESESERVDGSKAPLKSSGKAQHAGAVATSEVWGEGNQPSGSGFEHHSLPLRSRPQNALKSTKSPQPVQHTDHRPLALALDRSNLTSPCSFGDIISPWPRFQATGSTSRHRFSDSQSSISTHFTSVSAVQSPASSVSTAPDSYFMSVGSPEPWNSDTKLPLVREESPGTDELTQQTEVGHSHRAPLASDTIKRDILGLGDSSSHIDFARVRPRGISEPGPIPRIENSAPRFPAFTSESTVAGPSINMVSHKEMALRLSTDLPTHPHEAKPEKTHAVEEEAASESTISRQASHDAPGEEMVLGKRPSGQATELADTDLPTLASSPAGGLEEATEAAPTKVEGPECMFMEGCDTEASLRKAISHFFGRNKACTLRIPEEAWIYWCRKHYQRVRYRNSGTYGIQQMELVVEQIDRLENWSTQNQEKGRNKYLKDWVFALRKRARNDPVPDWMRPLLGHVHSTSTVRWIAKRVLKEFEAGKIDSVPEFEFLPNILGEDDDEERQKSGRGRRQKRKASDAGDEREEFSSSIAGSSPAKGPQKRSRTVDGVRPQHTNTLTPHKHAAATTDVEGFGTPTRLTLPPMKSRLDDNTQPQMTQTYDPFSSNAFGGNTHDQNANQSHATFSMPCLARSVSAGPEGSGSWIGGGGGGVNNSRYRVPGGYAPFSMDQPSAHNGNLGAAKQSLEYQNQLQATSQPLAQFQARAHGNLPFWAGTGPGNTTYTNVGSRARGGSQPIYHGPTMTLESGTRDPRMAAYSNHMQQLNNGMNQLFGTTGASDQHHMYGGQLFSLDAQGAQLPATYANSGNVLPQTYLPTSRAAAAAAAAAAVAAAQQGNNRQLTQLSLGLSNEAPVPGHSTSFAPAGGAQQFQAHSRATGGRARNLSADSNNDDNDDDDDDGQGNGEYSDDFLAKYASARFD